MHNAKCQLFHSDKYRYIGAEVQFCSSYCMIPFMLLLLGFVMAYAKMHDSVNSWGMFIILQYS